LAKVLTPDQMQLLRNLAADLNSSQLAMNSGRAVGSNTVQNLGTNNLLSGILGSHIGGSTPVTAMAGRLLQLPYGRANEQITERLGNALLNPQEAARILARRQGPMSPLVENALRLGYGAVPVIAAQ
jgi:hypothetical protein